jgi:hypothetical protein
MLAELVTEFLPIKEFKVARVLWQLLPAKDSCGPSLGMSGLHVGHRPYDLRLLVHEISCTELKVWHEFRNAIPLVWLLG